MKKFFKDKYFEIYNFGKDIISKVSNYVWLAVMIVLAFNLYQIGPEKEDQLSLLKVEETYRDNLCDALELDEATIVINDEGYSVLVEGNNCNIITNYSLDKKYLYTEFEDSSLGLIACIIIAVLVGLIASVVFELCSKIIFCIISLLWALISLLILALHKRKSKCEAAICTGESEECTDEPEEDR